MQLTHSEKSAQIRQQKVTFHAEKTLKRRQHMKTLRITK